jgi:redox-regulated HSP33 family molecular chaperone
MLIYVGQNCECGGALSIDTVTNVGVDETIPHSVNITAHCQNCNKKYHLKNVDGRNMKSKGV